MLLKMFAVVMISLCSTAHAWWDMGHMVTAQVAKNHLQAIGKSHILDEFEKLVKAFQNLTDGKSNSFIQAAVWPDDIKQYNATMFDYYHFTNIPIDPDFTFSSMNELQKDVNSINIINWCKSVLRTNTYSVTFERAFMARYLLHVVGDCHQPLHNTNFFNATFPKGDLGGNLIYVNTAGGRNIKLHNFFDSIALYQNPDQSIKRPLNASQLQIIQETASLVMKKYPFKTVKDQAQDINPHNWSVQAYQIAVDHIYKHLANSNEFTVEYQENIRQILFRQLALGGYRLAYAMIGVYETR